MILSCCKTGRWWRVASEPAGEALARRLGLKDFEIEQPSPREDLLSAWYELPPESRPDFFTYAHHHRRPEPVGTPHPHRSNP
ncbi:hypothetical protein FDP22_12445 [Paroceanicella profunda]|uniref:Uncharacterized protein n=1 Tax=Paroceanicella profunda TaxID=2579971 RepID=A0A5B8FHS1_9RHOB|nr:hypothetical protein [Paroceanicella profunda]QDL92517.1 hypothetical protein FDP22_12445 [Paroceanicella profunda]